MTGKYEAAAMRRQLAKTARGSVSINTMIPWTGKHQNTPIWILGNGPSLKTLKPEDLAGRLSIGVNRSLEYVPSPYWVGLDVGPFKQALKIGAEQTVYFTYEKYKRFLSSHVQMISRSRSHFIHPDVTDGIVFGNSSSLAALHIAILLGCKPIYLIGNEFCWDVESHFFGPRDTKDCFAKAVDCQGRTRWTKPNLLKACQNFERSYQAMKGRADIYDLSGGLLSKFMPSMTVDESFQNHPLQEIQLWKPSQGTVVPWRLLRNA